MKRKDLLFIVIAIVLISFIVVFAIYYKINNGEIFGIIGTNKEHNSNGWKTEIVAEIKDGVPIPVGFCYEEGTKSEGLIIKDKITDTKYMWIPYKKGIEIVQELPLELKGNTKQEKISLEEYGGFYIAIEKEEKNVLNKNLEELKIRNISKTDSVETHLITIEEFSLLKSFEKELGEEIIIKDYKALTVLGSDNQSKAEDKEDEIPNNWDNKIIEKVVNGVPVPKGFKHEEGTTIENGFKIKNENNLTFIWIPIELSEEEKSNDLGEVIKERFIKELEAVKADKELEIEKYKKYADEKTEEYKELMESIKKYGGFYISEAELGYDSNGTSINTYRDMYEIRGVETGNNYVSDGDYYRTVKEENYKKEVKELQKSFKLTYKSAIETCGELYGVSESVVSHLTYGLEYDAAVLYLLKHGKQADGTKITKEDLFNDSTEIGKYKGSEEAKYITREKSGLNGIYGLGGNLAELTRERDGENVIARGGYWKVKGNVETLASRVTTTLKEIEDDREAFGIRACIYIKPEYEDVTEELDEAKKEAKKRLKEAIDYIINLDKQSGEGIINENIAVVNKIKEYAEGKIDKESSIASLQELVIRGKIILQQVHYWVKEINNYPTWKNEDTNKYYTYGETKEECEKIKAKVIELIKNIEYDEENDAFKSEGKTVKLEDLAKQFEDEINEARAKYRENQIKEHITDYKNEIEKPYIEQLKNKAKKQELLYTEDFDKLKTGVEGSLIDKWQKIINVISDFDIEYSEDKEYYEDWKQIKEDAINGAITKTTLEEVNEIITKAKEKIEAKNAEKEKEKKAKEEQEKKEKEEKEKKAKEEQEKKDSTTLEKTVTETLKKLKEANKIEDYGFVQPDGTYYSAEKEKKTEDMQAFKMYLKDASGNKVGTSARIFIRIPQSITGLTYAGFMLRYPEGNKTQEEHEKIWKATRDSIGNITTNPWIWPRIDLMNYIKKTGYKVGSTAKKDSYGIQYNDDSGYDEFYITSSGNFAAYDMKDGNKKVASDKSVSKKQGGRFVIGFKVDSTATNTK